MSSGTERDERLDRAASALTRYAAAAQLADHEQGSAAGLTLHGVDATVLALLRLRGPLTPRELAREAGVSSSGTITGAIDRLERAGWTCRTPCRDDRRKVYVTLTETGSRTGVAPAVQAALENLTDSDLETLAAALDGVVPSDVPRLPAHPA